ncbi:Dipicolinate synthase subunit A [compost metagenome]
MKDILKQRNVSYYDLLDLEEVAILNAIPTAEGAIATAMEITDFTLNGSNVLIMGYGRIGKILSKMLSGIGSNVYCEARGEKDIAMIRAMGYNAVRLKDLDELLPKIDVIFNTIPIPLINEDRLKLLKKECSIIDLASPPGGVDFPKAKELGVNVVWALSLPAKVAPISAAAYLKETIDKLYDK